MGRDRKQIGEGKLHGHSRETVGRRGRVRRDRHANRQADRQRAGGRRGLGEGEGLSQVDYAGLSEGEGREAQ